MMTNSFNLPDDKTFAEILYEKMLFINPGIGELEHYEFEYCLDGIKPSNGWISQERTSIQNIVTMKFDDDFFEKVKLRPTSGKKIVLDETILWLTRQLFVGLVTGELSCEWVLKNFYFDIRSFCFYVRTQYYNAKIINHFGDQPYRIFEPKQNQFDSSQEIGYRDFRLANFEIDQAFIKIITQLIKRHGFPIMLALAGPTGAGKTEITEQISDFLLNEGLEITTIEMDNFFKDKEFRDGKVQGKEVVHFDIFMEAMQNLLDGNTVFIPRYDFYLTRSSHDQYGNLRSGQTPLEINPADVIFLEGNFPFHIPELENMIGLRIVYLTDDPIRLKRKWLRDIDLRKKYDPFAFVNRYFKTQYFRAKEIYLPLMEVCDLVVDTTAGCLWLTKDWQEKLKNLD